MAESQLCSPAVSALYELMRALMLQQSIVSENGFVHRVPIEKCVRNDPGIIHINRIQHENQ